MAKPEAVLRDLLLFSCSVVSDSLWPIDCSTPGFPVLHCLSEFRDYHMFKPLMQPACPFIVDHRALSVSGLKSISNGSDELFEFEKGLICTYWKVQLYSHWLIGVCLSKWASVMAQLVKSQPAMQGMWIWSASISASIRASQVAQWVKKPLANAGDIKDSGLIPGWGRSSEGGNGNLL